MDVMVKDSKRFKDTNSWGFFNFGHNAPPYLKAAKAAPAESCASCHSANAGKGMVFKTYYPVLR
jgi:mono/diheme cytochrome c family protein